VSGEERKRQRQLRSPPAIYQIVTHVGEGGYQFAYISHDARKRTVSRSLNRNERVLRFVDGTAVHNHMLRRLTEVLKECLDGAFPVVEGAGDKQYVCSWDVRHGICKF